MPPRARVALYGATLVALGLAVRSALGHPPPFAIALLATAGYAALLLGGVFILRWRVFADALVEGPPGARGVVLTFDDGPHPATTPRVLDILRDEGVTATFFVIGRKVDAYPDLVRRMLAEGHEVGLHGYCHDRFSALRSERRVRADLERGMEALALVLGRRPVLFRPPIGHTNPLIVRVADALGLTIVGWSNAAYDGIRSASANGALVRVTKRLHDGAILLMHDAAERDDFDPVGPRIVREVIARVRDQGLTVVPLTAWLSEGRS